MNILEIGQWWPTERTDLSAVAGVGVHDVARSLATASAPRLWQTTRAAQRNSSFYSQGVAVEEVLLNCNHLRWCGLCLFRVRSHRFSWRSLCAFSSCQHSAIVDAHAMHIFAYSWTAAHFGGPAVRAFAKFHQSHISALESVSAVAMESYVSESSFFLLPRCALRRSSGHQH